MLEPAQHPQEAERIAVLQAHQILDSTPEQSFDDLVQIASELAGVPIALVSLIDSDRQWFKAKVGLDADQTPRSVSFCGHAILDPEHRPFVIPDATKDARFADNPIVAGAPKVIFYAGIPLVVDDMPLGTLCVIDHQPREITPNILKALQAVARQVERMFALRQAGHVTKAALVRVQAAQAKAAEHWRYLEKVLETSPTAMFLTDAEGSCHYVNPVWQEIAGLTLEQAKGYGWVEAVHPEDRERVSNTWYEAAKSRVQFRSRHRFLRPDGRITWTEVTASAIMQETTVTGYVGITENITQRQEIEDGLRQAAKAKSDFLAVMSHEIRTPLNGVLGVSQLMADEALTTLQREYVDTIRSSGEGLLAIINDILDFSKIEAGQMELEQLAYDPRQLIEDIGGILAKKAHDKCLELVVDARPENLPLLLGDANRLRQILLNLVGNALKFTARGEVTLQVVWEASTNTVEYLVRDTGIGIPASRLSRLFLPFSQVDSSISREYGGTGLGLAISRRLALAMGGDITISSTEGTGSTFTVRIPAQPSEVIHQESLASINGAKLLLVEAHEATAAILERQLTGGGAVITRWQGPVDPALISQAFREGHFQVLIAGIPRSRPSPLGATLALPSCVVLAYMDQRQGLTGHADLAVIGRPVRRASLFQAVADVIRRIAPGLARPTSVDGPVANLNLRILVAEDNQVNQVVIKAFLGKMGCSPILVGDGAAAVAACAQGDIDLVLMDCQMPILDGYDATRQIRALPAPQSQVRIIALTANAGSEEEAICRNAGMDSYLAKPIRFETLESMLRSQH